MPQWMGWRVDRERKKAERKNRQNEKTIQMLKKRKENTVRYSELNIPVDSLVPEGYRLILAYSKGDVVRIPMCPEGLGEDHNCDWEGCSSIHHCLSISPKQKYNLDKPSDGFNQEINRLRAGIRRIAINLNDHSKYHKDEDSASFASALLNLINEF